MLARFQWIPQEQPLNLRGYRRAGQKQVSPFRHFSGGQEQGRQTRLVATMVSIVSGFNTMRVVIASTSILSTVTSGNSLATSCATSSQSTIPLRCALLFVTTVRSFRGRLWAVSNANRIIRSTPCLENMETSVATSQGFPRWERPPWPAYSPSLFSRTMTQSSSLLSQFRRADSTPLMILVGRTLAYCWKDWQMARRRFQSDMWSGTSAFGSG